MENYEIWGGDLNDAFFYDGGPASCLEGGLTLSEARKAVLDWRSKRNHAAWIWDPEKDQLVN